MTPRLRRLWPVLLLPMLLNAAESPKLGSTIFTWEGFTAKPTAVGERREVTRLPTATLREFQSHISTLNPTLASHPPHTHPQEELIILREGELDVHINGTNTRVGPGSVFFFASNDPHAVRNAGDKPATYFVFNFTTAVTAEMRGKAPLPADAARLGSAVFPWDKLVATETKVGERRALASLPTATLANFSVHVTTIRAGLAPHAPHRHPDEEIVLVKEGKLDVTVNGVTTRVGPGAVLFLASNDEHGWKNVGETDATYYVIRVKSEATPAVVAQN